MRAGKLLRPLAAVLGFALVGLVAYEGYAVWRAWEKTPSTVGAALAALKDLALSDLPDRWREILLAVEDPGFYRHHGIDLSSPGQGMTTITQALVKRFYFDPFRQGFAKIEQSLIARFVLDRYASKDEQLTLFLNHTYFGHFEGRDVQGFAAAAQTYFKTDFRSLSEEQFVALVAMLIAPNALDPVRHAQASCARVTRIRHLLAGSCVPSGVFDPWYDRCPSG